MSTETSLSTFRDEVIAGLAQKKSLLAIARQHHRLIQIYRDFVDDLDDLLAKAGYKPLRKRRFGTREIDAMLAAYDNDHDVTQESLAQQHGISGTRVNQLLAVARQRARFKLNEEKKQPQA